MFRVFKNVIGEHYEKNKNVKTNDDIDLSFIDKL